MPIRQPQRKAFAPSHNQRGAAKGQGWDSVNEKKATKVICIAKLPRFCETNQDQFTICRNCKRKVYA
jgi:hypothetical protein